jgi:oligopeptide/dipeptide ABC transporter ATP-binding protein
VSEAILEVNDLKMHFPVSAGVGTGGGLVRAVDGVSMVINEGEIVALVGESGSGKSTVGRAVMRLYEPTAGRIVLAGTDITELSQRELRPLRSQMNMVFQDPYSSLNPRMTVGRVVSEPLRLSGGLSKGEVDERVDQLFAAVRLNQDLQLRYPHELSGGQRQRIAIARALSLQPRLLIADEPTSSLDVSSQAAIINLLRELQGEMGFSSLFITHDLALAEFFADRVLVMYLGKVFEAADTEVLVKSTKHPYSQALLSAVPVPDSKIQRQRARIMLEGDIPNPINPPDGCVFNTRCPVAQDVCFTDEPLLKDLVTDGRHHRVACHLVGENGDGPDLLRLHEAGQLTASPPSATS